MYWKRHARQPGVFEQIRQLTELRSAEPWLADVPRNICEQVLIDMDIAWQRYFQKTSGRPRWKKKSGPAIGLTESHFGMFRCTQAGVVFPKLGLVPANFHRPLVGKPKRCTISRDADQWFASILCEQEIPTPEPKLDPVVGIDRGITNLVADSNGRIVPNPKHAEAIQHRLAHAQRVVARRKKGSKRRELAKLRVAKLCRKVRRQRGHTLHVLSASYAQVGGTVVIEKLNVAGLGKGKLARQVHGAGWSAFVAMLRYKLEARGGQVVEVPAAYSSQTCTECQHVDAGNRKGESFHCTKCGHKAHADVNAAKVLVQRYSRRDDGVAGRGGSGEASPPKKRQLRVVRRGSSKKIVTAEGHGLLE